METPIQITDELTLRVLKKIFDDKEKQEKFNIEQEKKRQVRKENRNKFIEMAKHHLDSNKKDLKCALETHEKLTSIDYYFNGSHIHLIKKNLEHIETLVRGIYLSQWKADNIDIYFPNDYPDHSFQ